MSKHKISKYDLSEPYFNFDSQKWLVDEALHPESRGYIERTFDTRAEAEEFIEQCDDTLDPEDKIMTRIEEIKALCDAATKGPWDIERTRTTLWVGQLRHNSHKVDDIVVSVEIEDLNKVALSVAEANAELISQSRTLVPELLGLVIAQNEALEIIKEGKMVKNIIASESFGQDMWTSDPKTIAKQTIAQFKEWNEVV